MQVGAVSRERVVTADAALLQTETTQVGSVIDRAPSSTRR